MKSVKTAKLGGQVYDIVTSRISGMVFDQRTRNTIIVNRRLERRNGLETIIHEAIHACYPLLPEWRVDGGAGEIARLLWRLGYRRTTR